MKLFVCCFPLLVLTACQPQPAVSVEGATPAPPAHAAATSSGQVPTATMQDDGTAAETTSATPSFDCGKTSSQVEKLVCADAELAALDRQLADRYDAALARAGANKSMLMSSERGWLKGRDDCWKTSDMRQCLLESYQTQLVDLQINHGDATTAVAVEYSCDDNSKPLSAVFYNQLQPQAAMLSWGEDQAIVFAQPSASGIRYGRTGVSLQEHQGQVTVDIHGTQLSCSASR